MKKLLFSVAVATVAICSAPVGAESTNEPSYKVDIAAVTAGLTGRDLKRVTNAARTYNSHQCQDLFKAQRNREQFVWASDTLIYACADAAKVLKEAQDAR